METRNRSRPTCGRLALGFSVLALAGCYGPEVLSVSTSDGQRHCFTVTIADTPEKQRQGLMYVQELPADSGVLFDYPEEKEVSMWMRNTYIPLDMIFIRADGSIANIVERTKPRSEARVFSDGRVKAVLELNGGITQTLGIVAGDTVHHLAFDNATFCPALFGLM